MKKPGDLNYIYKNKLDKASFAQDAAYGNSKHLGQRTVSEKVFKDRNYEIALNPKFFEY